MPVSLPLNYNERSWAIDVISEINEYSLSRSRAVVRAGGEHTISGSSGSLFPDVLLFGDNSGSVVLQGWELKMPDTAINDQELLRNAEQKARRLGLNSFVVWNVDEAVLYIQDASGNFVYKKAWPPTNIKRRAEVASNRSIWISLLHKIIDDLNDLLDYGEINASRPERAISDTLFVDYLEYFTPLLAINIKRACQRDAIFASELTVWWAENKIEHPCSDEYQAIARVNLINWINRILFAHYLKRFHNAAKAVESINSGTSVREAIEVFDNISSSCDFMNVFRPVLGQEYMDAMTWAGLLDLNIFLKDFKLESISQTSFHKIIDMALAYSRKKLAGQFSTPKPLADLLVRLTIKDRTKPVIDPCCGTGTIARAAYDLKRSIGVPVSDALRGIWGSDKFAFPLQLCSIALSDPVAMGEIVRVFRFDAFQLTAGQTVTFTDPNTGNDTTHKLPRMHAVISNLPFVRFEDAEKLNPSLSGARNTLVYNCVGGRILDRRSDLYAYLILSLREIIESHGRIGVIISNSWLGGEWGQQFRRILMNCFHICQIVISGEGRWFENADVVTTILVLEKKSSQRQPSKEISFLTTTNKLEDWGNLTGGIDQLAAYMIASKKSGPGYTKQSYSYDQIQTFESMGIGWNALFVDMSWFGPLAKSLIPANSLFEIKRGERRGWDRLFYPEDGHGIEPQYIRPVLKSARNISGLIATACDDAFCCSEDLDTLNSKGMNGALAWIARFQNSVNGTGQPLPNVLARPGCHWYEMSPTTLADMVISMNPDQRLCVHKMKERAFVNQRLIRFTCNPDCVVDVDLCHALMNSIVGMFLIEAIGFGRGLGVLDLNASKLSRQLHLLNPNAISEAQREEIMEAFSPLLKRDVCNLTEELEMLDRKHFDQVVLKVFGAENLQDKIYKSIKHLFYIRQAARM